MHKQNNPLAGLASNLVVGQKQQFKNMTVFPLFTSIKEDCDYLSLSEAIENQSIEITEIDNQGSVPELKVINKGHKKVLFLDSEELKGAKQNRILNTSVLIKKESETVIPVSCTERGRWDYRSPNFTTSGHMGFSGLRKSKSKSVAYSLKISKSFRSDQSEVWNSIDKNMDNLNVHSHTSAMEDSYSSRHNDLEDYMKAFVPIKNQRGILVMINGKAVGLDFISSDKVYSSVHTKLTRSYSMQALTQLPAIDEEATSDQLPDVFLNKIIHANVESYNSPGHGKDYRIEPNVVIGHGLVYKKEVIQMSVFADDSSR